MRVAELTDSLDDEQLRAGHLACLGLATFFTSDLLGDAELLERALARDKRLRIRGPCSARYGRRDQPLADGEHRETAQALVWVPFVRR